MFREGALKCEHFLFVFHFGTKELYVSFSRTNTSIHILSLKLENYFPEIKPNSR